jgi:hypothetical protein
VVTECAQGLPVGLTRLLLMTTIVGVLLVADVVTALAVRVVVTATITAPAAHAVITTTTAAQEGTDRLLPVDLSTTTLLPVVATRTLIGAITLPSRMSTAGRHMTARLLHATSRLVMVPTPGRTDTLRVTAGMSVVATGN